MSEGFCAVDFEDYSDNADPVEFHYSKLVVAKKTHVCSGCRGAIVVGERYQRTAYKFEGEFRKDRCCACCFEAAEEFHYYIMGGDLWAMFQDEWANGANLQGCMNRLTTAKAKEHMRRQWLKWKKLPVDAEGAISAPPPGMPTT